MNVTCIAISLLKSTRRDDVEVIRISSTFPSSNMFYTVSHRGCFGLRSTHPAETIHPSSSTFSNLDTMSGVGLREFLSTCFFRTTTGIKAVTATIDSDSTTTQGGTPSFS